MNYSISSRIANWVIRVFSPDVFYNQDERTLRVFEEATELTQAKGIPRHKAHALVDYVYDRAPGVPEQEIAGVTLTLQALAASNHLSLLEIATQEMDRIEAMPDHKFREKQIQKANAGFSMRIDYL